MSTLSKVLIGFVVLIIIGGVGLVGTAVNTYNTCVTMEENLEAQYQNNQSSYDNYYKKVVESAGVTDKYADDFKKMYDSVMQGRYGKDGSKAMFQMITEQNPQVDASLYKQIQQIIESGRNSFHADQQSLLDKKRVYNTYLKKLVSGTFAKFMGFPKKNLDEIGIVTSDRTDSAFKTKKDNPIRIHNK